MNGVSGERTIRRRHLDDAIEGRHRLARAAWVLACEVASQETGADVRQVVQTRGTPGRGSDAVVARARKLACYLAQVTANIEPTQLARAAGLHRKTLAEHCLWVEERRDGAAFDHQVQAMEDQLLTLAARMALTRLRDVAEPEAA